MKQLKHILSFFLLLILQLTFANSFASVYLNKDKVVSRIEFSETVKSNPDFSEPSFKENHIFEPSFHDIISCPSISCGVVYAESVDSWKILDDAGVNDVLRKNVDRLTDVDNYFKKNPGTEEAFKQGLKDVGDYQEEFLNGIRNATDDLSHVNGRSALPDEIADATNRIKHPPPTAASLQLVAKQRS